LSSLDVIQTFVVGDVFDLNNVLDVFEVQVMGKVAALKVNDTQFWEDDNKSVPVTHHMMTGC
jgi:hypothetical protein